MKNLTEKKALKKHHVLEPFFAGPEDKRTTRIEIHDRVGLMFCSFKRRSRVGSDIKIVSCDTGNIVQTVPPRAYFTTAKTSEDGVDELSFLKVHKKKMDTSEIDSDLVAKDHVITFTSFDLMSSETKHDDPRIRNSIHMVTAHASGLLKEWFVNKEVSEEQPSPVVVVHLKRTWRSFHQSPISVLHFGYCFPIQGFVASGGSSDSIIKVWDLNQGYCTHSLKLKAGSTSVISFHVATRGGKRRYFLFGSGELNNSIQIFDLESSSLIGSLSGHVSMVTSIVFLNEDTLLSSSRDKMLITWDLKSFTALKQIPVFESIDDMLVRNIKETQVALTVGQQGMVRVIHPNTGKILASTTTTSHGKSFPLKQILAFQDTIVSVSDQNHIHFHSIIHDSLTKSLEIEMNRQMVGELDQVLSVKFIGQKAQHVVVASNSPLLKIYSLKDKNACQVFSGHEDIILSIQVIPYNRDVFLTSSKDNTILVWRFTILGDSESHFSATPLYAGSGHFRSVTALCVPAKGHDFAISASEDCILKVWKIPSATFDDVEHRPQLGQLVSLASVKGHDKDVNSISVAPNDQIVASGSKDKTCKLWNLDPKTKQLSLLATLRGHRKTVWTTDFSPLDKLVLTGSGDCSIKIWSLNDYSCVRTFNINDSSVYLCAKFISNGTQVIASSADALIRIFSVKTSETVLTLDPCLHSEVVADLSKKPFKTENSVKENGDDDVEDDDCRIWSLEFNTVEDTLVFGSGSRVYLFQDCTETAQEEYLSKQEELIVHDQKLQNLLQNKKFEKALAIAIKLERPFQCLDILRQIALADPDPVTKEENEEFVEPPFGVKRVEEVLNCLRNDQLLYLLKLAAFKWNTNSKHCILAQVVMKVCLPKIIRELVVNDFSQDLMSLKSLVEAMISYSERHEGRIKKQVMNSHFLRFMSQDVMSSLPLQDIKLDEDDHPQEQPSNMEVDDTIGEEAPLESKTMKESADLNDDSEGLSSGEETDSTRKPTILGDEKKNKKSVGKNSFKGKGKTNRKKTRDRL